jgi:hypothetical protein
MNYENHSNKYLNKQQNREHTMRGTVEDGITSTEFSSRDKLEKLK